MMLRILLCCAALIALLAVPTQAQDYDIQRFDVNVQLQPATNTAQVQAKLVLINNSTQGRSGQFVNLRVNKRAKVTEASVDNNTTQFRQKNDERLSELANVSIDFPKPLPPGGTANVSLNYTLEVKDNTTISVITPAETILLPESFWVPLVHTPFLPYGLDVAPTTVTVTGVENARVYADGKRNGNTFSQSVPAQPLLISTNFDEPVTIKAGNTSFEFVYAKGLGGTARKQAEALATEMAKMLETYNKLVGLNIPADLRVIASSQVSSYVTGTTVILGEDVFRREVPDLETIEFLARAMLRSRIGGETSPRGKGWTLLFDALPTYLAGLYFEQRYGEKGGREFFERRIRSYAPVVAAKTDGPLIVATPLDNTYATSMFNKGPLMFRIMERQVGRDKLLATINDLLNNKTKQLRYDDLKKALIGLNGDLAGFFDQWIEKIAEPDFIIGVPLAENGAWKCALRNLEQGAAKVNIVAVTEQGTRLTESVLIPSQGRAEVIFKTTEKLATVEVDPDKLYPQSNYDNDARPPVPSTFSLFRDANTSFNRKDYADTEAKLRPAIAREPLNAILRTLLVRALIASNKFDEAKSEIDAIEKLAPLPSYSLIWCNYALGEIATAKGQKPEAVAAYRRALAVGKDIVPIRLKVIEAEKAAGQLSLGDDSIRNFLGQLDKAIKDSGSQALEQVMVRANLNKFMKGLIGNKPDSWVTDIRRVDAITNDKSVVDVEITVVTSSKQEQRGTAVLILQRTANGWILNNIDQFNVE